MKMIKTIVIGIVFAVLLALCINGAGRLAYARGWIDIDVSDEHGHGPDRGPEWDSAARFHISRTAILSGLVCFPLAVFGLTVRRKLKCEHLPHVRK